MTVQGMATCAHCGALLASSICSICGKSVTDEVEVVEVEADRRGMSDEGRRQIRNFGAFVGGVLVLVAVGYVLLNRESPEPIPTMLATPDPIESTTTVAPPTVDPPTIARSVAPAEPLPTLPVEVDNEVVAGDGANPWAGAPPRNVFTGALLDNTDYGPGIDAVAAVLEIAPAGFSFATSTLAEWNGVDLAAAETAQPFAARGIAGDTGPIADVWIFATGDAADDGSAAFYDQALDRWPIDEPIDSFSPRPGVRIHQVGADGADTIWVDQRDRWMLVYRAPAGTDPGLLGAVSDDWN